MLNKMEREGLIPPLSQYLHIVDQAASPQQTGRNNGGVRRDSNLIS